MKNRNYFALYAFDQKPEMASRESYAMKLVVAFALVLFTTMTLIAVR